MPRPDKAYLFILNFFGKDERKHLFRYDNETQTVTLTVSLLHMLINEAMQNEHASRVSGSDGR